MLAFHPGRAIYNGSDHEWQLWDWNVLTTVVTVAYCADGAYCDYPIAPFRTRNVSKALLCHAHRHGVRVVSFTYWNWNTPDTWAQLANASRRREWVEWEVSAAQRLGLDGVNVTTHRISHHA